MKLGKHWVNHIEPSDTPERWIAAVNEIPAGSSCKYRLDKVTGQLTLARALPRAVRFPCNYGFVPHTRCAADDEEMDILIVASEPILPLTIVHVRVIGGFLEKPSDESKAEDRLIAVASDDPGVREIEDLSGLDDGLRERIETFTRTYKRDENIDVTFEGWFDRAAALDHLQRAFKRAKKRAPV